ncbi:histone-like nucleoid structuring protein [Aeromonas hydrophila]|uniref:histone-like nucleoid structuring protein n=1 Tax=Aeromonas hydrophila TaxID=644 RepID=UPI0038D0FF56
MARNKKYRPHHHIGVKAKSELRAPPTQHKKEDIKINDDMFADDNKVEQPTKIKRVLRGSKTDNNKDKNSKIKTTERPYSIYDCDKEWLLAAQRTRKNPHLAIRHEGLSKNGLQIENDTPIGHFIENNKSSEVTYYQKIIATEDYSNFEHIYNILLFISSVREYSYHEQFKIGRQFKNNNRLELTVQDEVNLNKALVYSAQQKVEIKNKIRILLRSNVNNILNNQDYLEHFDVHPAVSIFIKIVNENGIDITYRDDFEEYFSIDLMTAFINKFNATYNSPHYKEEVSKRLFNVRKNINSITDFINRKVDGDSTHVIRCCLGFNCIFDGGYDSKYEKEIYEIYKSPNSLYYYKLTKLFDGRDAIFRRGAKKPVMKYIDGYIWKVDYCSIRKYYLHLFLFLKPDWGKSFDIVEEIGNMWRSNVINGDVFKYSGEIDNFPIKNKSGRDMLAKSLNDLFIQDILAYAIVRKPNEKHLRSFGKSGNNKSTDNPLQKTIKSTPVKI